MYERHGLGCYPPGNVTWKISIELLFSFLEWSPKVSCGANQIHNISSDNFQQLLMSSSVLWLVIGGPLQGNMSRHRFYYIVLFLLHSKHSPWGTSKWYLFTYKICCIDMLNWRKTTINQAVNHYTIDWGSQ
jgi:hypothetical protein